MEDLYNDYLKKLALSQNPEDKLSPTWDEMNKRLNKEMPQKKDRKKIIFFWASLFLILSVGLGYYFIANDSKSTALQGNNTSIFDKEKNGNDVRFNTPSKLNNIGTIDEKIPINEGLLAGNSTSSTKPVIFKKEAKRVFSNAPIYGKSLPNKNIFQNEKKIAVSNIGLANPVSIPGKKSVNKQTQNQANIEQTVRDNNDQSDINLRDKNEKPAFGKSNDALIPAEKSKENIKVDSVVSTVKDGQPINTEKKKISNSKHATWELVPTVAADYLIANIKPFTIPGFLAGVGVNYVINKHVSLRAGVLFNHIRVSSTGENYYYKPQYTAPNFSTVKV